MEAKLYRNIFLNMAIQPVFSHVWDVDHFKHLLSETNKITIWSIIHYLSIHLDTRECSWTFILDSQMSQHRASYDDMDAAHTLNQTLAHLFPDILHLQVGSVNVPLKTSIGNWFPVMCAKLRNQVPNQISSTDAPYHLSRLACILKTYADLFPMDKNISDELWRHYCDTKAWCEAAALLPQQHTMVGHKHLRSVDHTDDASWDSDFDDSDLESKTLATPSTNPMIKRQKTL